MASIQLDRYKDERFEGPVDENFHCPICFNVLREPMMCQRNQHCFCTSCITKHLQNSPACPLCGEELTVDTLCPPPRILTSCLSSLRIHCDYFERGCTGFVRLEDLETHVENCGFSPVLCSNEGCLAEINKRDRAHHEAENCQFRKLKCHECGELRREIEGIKESLTEMKVEVTDQIRCMQEEMIKYVGDMTDDMKGEIKSLKQLIETSFQSNTKGKGDIVVAGGDGVRSELCSVELFEWSKMSWASLKPMSTARSGASAVVHRNQIIVAGGHDKIVSYRCKGGDVEYDENGSMEKINIKQLLQEQWSDFPVELPLEEKYSSFRGMLYEDRLIAIGGTYFDSGRFDMVSVDGIYEILLDQPHTERLLATMPEPRCYHGAELLNDKIVILGGQTHSKKRNSRKTLDRVLIYNFDSNECEEVTPLPFAVSRMATVSFADNVIVIGGCDKNKKVLNTVVMYNVSTGESKLLPGMKYPRACCSAVITGNVVVVIGGFDEQYLDLTSVECYELDQYVWRELPPMKEARSRCAAVVKPINMD